MSIFTEGIAPPYNELTNGPWSFDIGALDTGKIAFARVGPWLFSDMQKNPNYGITPLFTIKTPLVLGGVNGLSIYRNSKNAAAAWEFLKWATQTPAEISFAKFSDLPAEKNAFAQLSTYIQPANFAQTMLAAVPTFQPSVMTTKDQLASTLGDIITDMMAGKLTPTQAAAKMEQQGNAILSASS
jgi:ABC-type glycerol-3-phosphate transport system substrate-binding protein